MFQIQINKMKAVFSFLFLALCIMACSSNSHAAVKRMFQDIKLPSQAMLEKQTVVTPIAANTSYVLSANQGPTSAAALDLTTGLTSPDVPRNLTITPGGSTGDVAACTITVTGKDFYGRTITEDFAFSANASTATTGSKAFKTVTSVSFPASCEDLPYLATWNIGVGEKIGLKNCLDAAGHYVFSTVGGVYETTRGTIAANASVVASNTIDFNGTMDGLTNFEVFFVQNFRCKP